MQTVGKCACGTAIAIGDTYKVPVKGPYTIKRPCQGYRCTRINEVTLQVSVKVEKANWHILDCECGAPMYLRTDYKGEGNGLWVNTADQKNRTVVQYCRRCKCRWKFVIRFEKKEDGGVRRTTTPWHRVCASCKAQRPQEVEAS